MIDWFKNVMIWILDIRKFKVLVEFFNKEEQCFAIKHTQDEASMFSYFVYFLIIEIIDYVFFFDKILLIF